MTSKRRQQQRNRFKSSSPLIISPENVNTTPTESSQPVNEQHSDDSQRVSSAAIVENPNDRFIHETGPPTAHSVLRNQPAFIGKLYKMLEDDTQDLIHWSSNGEYFSVHNFALFSKQILPQYFKHSNWQSFVRQLNMYGFSKINDMIHSNLSFENQTWDFKHPHFKRGDFYSLGLVKRKSVRSAPGPVPSHIGSPSSVSSHLMQYHFQPNEIGGTGMGTLPQGASSSQQQPSSEARIIEVDGGVESRVMQLDQQVLQVSQSVAQLTSEMQDIKSLIYNQQTMIHDLAELLRSYRAKTDFSSSVTASISSSSIDTEETQQPTTSLPSIHNLANNLRHAANINTSGPPHQYRLSHPYSYHDSTHSFPSFPQAPAHSSPTHSPTSSTRSLPLHQGSHHFHHHQHYHPPPSDDSRPQRRRSSHPSSNNPLYPLLNSTLNHNNPYR